MADVCREVRQISSELRMQKRMADWSATAQRIVAELASPPLGNIVNVRRSLMEQDLDKAKLVVFELDLFSHVQYSYLVISFLVREYLRRLGTERRDELQKAIIIEEAGRIFNQPYPQPMFETVVKEIRETGTGLIWLNQSASEVNHTAWANTNTLFVFKQISGQDINTVGSAMAFERPREKMYCARLGVGEAIVRLPDRYQFPFLIRTKDIKKIPVPDEKVREMALEHLEALGAPLPEPTQDRIPVSGEKIARVPVSQFAENQPAGPQAGNGRDRYSDSLQASAPVGKEESALQGNGEQSAPTDQEDASEQSFGFASKAEEYEACMAHLLDRVQKVDQKPLTYMYAELGLSKSKGSRVRDRLVAAGLVEQVGVTSPEGRPELRLVPTAQAGRWLEEHRHLLAKKLVRWQTQRFGGRLSKELSDLAIQWANTVRKAKHLGTEVPDGFGGMWDNLFEGKEGQFVIESITGESKTHEALHVQKALETGVPIFCLCLDGRIRARILRYLDAQRIVVDGRAVSLLTAEQARQQIEEAKKMAEWVSGDLNRPPVSGEPDPPPLGKPVGTT